MSLGADRPLAVLDANVLYPFRTRDILLSFHHAGLFQARWTREILAEWRGSLIARKPHLGPSVDAQMGIMTSVFPEALVAGDDRLIAGLSLPDPDDRHVLAAAIASGAGVIVTENLADFPADVLARHGCEAVGADVFLTRCFDADPGAGARTLEDVRLRYRNPPFTPAAFVADVAAKGLPRLASRMARHGAAG